MSVRIIRRIFGPISLLLALHLWTSVCRSTSGATCETIRIPMCRSMPYNITQIPNLLHHSNQLNALLVLEQYQPLVATNCSGVLLFLLCALFTPVCPINFSQEVIPPCQDVCLRAKRGCEPVLAAYNLTWPTDLNCNDLPTYETGVCISPEAINSSPAKRGRMILKRKVKTLAESSKKPRRQRKTKDCSSFHDLLKQKPSAENSYPPAPDASLLVRATLLKFNMHSKDEVNLTFMIKEIFRSSQTNFTVNQTIEVATSSKFLKNPGRCVPKSLDSLRLSRDYVLLVEVEKIKSRLHFVCSKDCVIQPWNKSFHKTIQKWKSDNRLKTNSNQNRSSAFEASKRKSIRTKQQKKRHQRLWMGAELKQK